jgi:hypothetical protein
MGSVELLVGFEVQIALVDPPTGKMQPSCGPIPTTRDLKSPTRSL